MTVLPWDMNASFGGNNWLTIVQKQRLDPFYFKTRTDRPLLNKCLAVPEFRARYFAHYKHMLEAAYSWPILGGKIAQWQKLIEKDLSADSKKLYSMTEFRNNVTRDLRVRTGRFNAAWIPGMKPFIEARRGFLLKHVEINRSFPEVTSAWNLPVTPSQGQSVQMLARVSLTVKPTGVWLYHRKKGAYTRSRMFDDGKHGDAKSGDGLYGLLLPGESWGDLVEYYVFAQSSSGTVAFYPETASHKPLSYRVALPNGGPGLRINEFVALNTVGIRDEKGEFEDWLELSNETAQPLAVAGMFLTDDLGNPTKWRIPATPPLAPSGKLLVWADKDGNQGPMHANFKLKSAGEEIALFAGDGKTLMDFVAFGQQLKDVSTARLVDGSLPWVTLISPTPLISNRPSPCGSRAYNVLRPWEHRMNQGLVGIPKIGTSPQYVLKNAVPNSVALLLMTASGTTIPLFKGATLLVGPPFLALLALPTSSSGAVSLLLPLPNDSRLVGVSLYLQAFGQTQDGFIASNGLELRFCR